MQVKLPYAIRVLIVCYKEDLVSSCLSSSTLTTTFVRAVMWVTRLVSTLCLLVKSDNWHALC